MNKEQLRKEFVECYNAGAYYALNPELHPQYKREDFITTRLAALDDGDDEINPETGKPYFEGLNKKGQWNKQFVDDGQEGKGLDDLKLLQLAADNIEDENLSIRERAFAKEWWVEGYRFAKAALPVGDGEGLQDVINHQSKSILKYSEEIISLKQQLAAVTGGVKDEIIKLQDEYIEFLDRESSPFISFAFTHNMVVPEKVVNEGKAYREKIASLKRQSEGQPAQEKCPRCKGEGTVEKNVRGWEGEPEYDTEVECPECGGSGIEND